MMTEPSNIYPKLAEKFGLTEDQIRSIIIYYWRSGVKRSLEAIISDEIYVNRLGSFKIKDWKLKYIIPQSYAFSKKEGSHERNVEYFTALNSRLIQVEERLKEKLTKNQEFRECIKESARDIQEPPSDMGGTAE